MTEPASSRPAWRHRIHEIIFEADTPAGKAFDVGLLVAIGASVLCVILESIPDLDPRVDHALIAAEWVFTLLFSVEYVLRLIAVERKLRYALSFFGGFVAFLGIIGWSNEPAAATDPHHAAPGTQH